MEFRGKLKESLSDFLPHDLRNTEIKNAEVNKQQNESYSEITVVPEGSCVGVNCKLEDTFLKYQMKSQFTKGVACLLLLSEYWENRIV